ncbi:multidrug resistance-associated protein 5 [Tanacetum coccineum]
MILGTNLHQFDVHNDGYFSQLPLTYVDGVILGMAVQRMPYEEFTVYLEEKCGCYFQGLYYQVPSQDLEMGLVRVSDDRSLSYMFAVEETFGRLNLYLDHLDMDLSEYLSQGITYDIDACVSKTINPPKKRYCNDFSLDEMVDWAEMEVDATDGVEARTSTTKVNATDGVEARTSTTEVNATDGVDATDKGKEKYDSDDDSDYQSDNSVDYLSLGEEELIELRNRMEANRKAKAKAKDNLVFKMNEPNNKNSMPADNVRGETFEEHDIYMNQLLKSLNTADKDGITEDPFISVEKHVEGLVKSMSGEVRVVAKYGQRPPRLSALEKEDEHTCVRNFNFGSLINYKWIAKVFGEKIRANPYIRLCDVADLVMKKYKCKVSPNQCTNAKKYALIEYEKTFGEHYAMLRSYGKAILDSNPGSTVKLGVTVNPDGKTYFDRFYVCFAGLADGWKAGCRKIIALDGCFLKSPNQDNRTWFLDLLEQDLGSSRGNGLTLMTDQHKGLIEAVKDVMPNAEQRQCARRIYKNFKKQYPGLEFRQLFWAASKASYPQLFNKVMDKIKSANPNVHKYLMDKNPKSWSRAFFEVDRGCEAIKNGFSECFNSVIVNVRYTPLLTMLEAIRVILSGIPCVHATKVIFLINMVPESYVPAWFETDMYFVTYHNYVKLVPGMNLWPDQSMCSTILPPKLRKMPCRPRKKRIRFVGEGGSLTRVSKVGGKANCSNCKKPRHNKASCTELVVEQPPKPKGVVGRPRNKQSVDDLEDVNVVQSSEG